VLARATPPDPNDGSRSPSSLSRATAARVRVNGNSL
jgi:hypothetical protein